MLLPSLMDLRCKVSITLVGRKPGLEYVGKYVDAIMDFEGPGWHRLFMEHADCRDLPISETDSVVAFLRDEDGHICRNLKIFFPQAEVHVFPGHVPNGRAIHVSLYLAECMRLAGLPIDPVGSVENFSRQGLMEKGHSSRKRTFAVLHPGSGDPKKNYPPEFMIQILKRICQERNFRHLRSVVLLGPAEEYLYPTLKSLPKMMDYEIRICPNASQLMELLKNAALYLGHDSGITHLSAMLCAPTIALFKTTKIEHWRPLGPHVEVINTGRPPAGIMEQAVRAAKAL
jgi:heptosyltransferase-3